MSVEILTGASQEEKRAYIAAIASIATADNVASENEINYLVDLGKHAGLSEDDQAYVKEAAMDPSGGQLRDSLDVLKSSELRFSLVTDLIAFAESDQQLAGEEKTHISSVANYLGVDAKQVEMLQEYVQYAASNPINQFSSGDQAGGLMDKLKGSGIDMGMLTKGLISFVGPMILGNLVSKGMNKGGKTGNAGLGGLGDLGSLVSGLTGGKGMSGIGGFLSNLLK